VRKLVEQGRVEIRVWDGDGVAMEPEVLNQMRSIASLPVVTGFAQERPCSAISWATANLYGHSVWS
jgi:hypothetical protein